jgi:hypothetical protein
MHGKTQRDLIQTLNSMANEALSRNYNNRIAAREDMARYIQNDKRFSEGLNPWGIKYDATVLAHRYEEARNCGAVLHLDDPRLRAGGGQARPLAKDAYW